MKLVYFSYIMTNMSSKNIFNKGEHVNSFPKKSAQSLNKCLLVNKNQALLNDDLLQLEAVGPIN